MRKISFSIPAIIVISGFVFNACSKSADANLFDKWQVVSDSLQSISAGIDSQRYYTGRPGDYFDFGVNDILYVREDTWLDTVPFLLLSYNKIVLEGLGVSQDDYSKGHDIDIHPQTITLVVASSFATGGSYKRTIHLAK
jgi:hypothetical protein